MNTFLYMLPVYLLGNFHCIGMCGPLAVMIGHQKWRSLYMLGRFVSFSLAGLIAGQIGIVSSDLLAQYHLDALFSLTLALFMLALALATLFGLPIAVHLPTSIQNRLTKALMSASPFSLFAFGFFTVALPCGQSLFVFSACAITASPWEGLFNGAAFAILTTPALFLAMQATKFLKGVSYNNAVGGCAIIAALLMICRSLADLEVIDHLLLSKELHLMLF